MTGGDYYSEHGQFHLRPCMDCGIDTSNAHLAEDFMVHDDVWHEAGLPPAGTEPIGAYQVCVGCIELRLGRLLSSEDFTHAQVNAEPPLYVHSERLTDRLRSRRPRVDKMSW